MGISVEVIKMMYSALKEANRLDLAEQLNDLRAEMIDAKETNLVLREEVASLKKHLEMKSKIVFDKGICWIEDDEMTENDDRTPICPQCWQANGVLNRLPIQEYAITGPGVNCHKCKMVFEIV